MHVYISLFLSLFTFQTICKALRKIIILKLEHETILRQSIVVLEYMYSYIIHTNILYYFIGIMPHFKILEIILLGFRV